MFGSYGLTRIAFDRFINVLERRFGYNRHREPLVGLEENQSLVERIEHYAMNFPPRESDYLLLGLVVQEFRWKLKVSEVKPAPPMFDEYPWTVGGKNVH